jgi:hypothetical protein
MLPESTLCAYPFLRRPAIGDETASRLSPYRRHLASLSAAYHSIEICAPPIDEIGDTLLRDLEAVSRVLMAAIDIKINSLKYTASTQDLFALLLCSRAAQQRAYQDMRNGLNVRADVEDVAKELETRNRRIALRHGYLTPSAATFPSLFEKEPPPVSDRSFPGSWYP